MKISRLSFVIALFSAFLTTSLVRADEFGTAAEAQALLTRAVAEDLSPDVRDIVTRTLA